MAEGRNNNSGGMRFPGGQGMGYSSGAYGPHPISYQPVPIPTFQPPYPPDMYASYPRGMPYPQYQGNTVCQEGVDYNGAAHHYQSNAQYQAVQNQGNVQYANYMIPPNHGSQLYQTDYSNYSNLDPSGQISTTAYPAAPRLYNNNHGHQNFGRGVSSSLNEKPPQYNTDKMESQWSPSLPMNSVDGMAKGVTGENQVSQNNDYCDYKAVDHSNNSVNSRNPNESYVYRNDIVNVAPPGPPGNISVNVPPPVPPVNISLNVPPPGNISEDGARFKGAPPPRGLGGRGRRRMRRSYGGGGERTTSSVQETNTGSERYDPRGSRREYELEDMKRDQAQAVAQTAKFLQTLTFGNGEVSESRNEEVGIDNMKNRSGRGKPDRGGKGGGKHSQRDHHQEEKQGKDRKNEQVRTEEGKFVSEVYNNNNSNNTPQTDSQGQQGRYDRFNARGRGRTFYNQPRTYDRYGNTYNQYRQAEQVENPAYWNSRSPFVKPPKILSKNKQEKKLWANSEQNDSTGNNLSSGQNGNKAKAEYEDVPSSTPALVVEGKEDEETQRDRLIEQLTRGTYECMVCCDRIKQQHAIWSCVSCYNCFHLGCIKKWAKTSTAESGWRCPACQGCTPKVPNAYRCFCGKLREPDWNRRDTPHSCGEVCGRLRKIEWCKHKCNILCHPGPCPPCSAYIKRSCPCGAETRDVRCSVVEPFLCGGVCGKVLNCKGHKCERSCHVGPCEDCQQKILQNCYCGKEKREMPCTTETFGVTVFSCEGKCLRTLECGNHQCEEKCHEGECKPCERAVSAVTRCPCDKVPLEKLYERDGAPQRKSCSDPIPTCSQPCQRMLKCGVPGSYHECQALCHEGPCPPCPLETPVKCRCGTMDQNVPCSELTTKADEVTCKKPCKKLRQCSRHKCGTKCCIDVDHICMLVCGRILSCGLHKCEEQCHRGNCPRCWQTSFEELTCHCGAAVIYPPVPCGTKPPGCEKICIRPQSCSHQATHNCHSDESCPPCTILVDKPCFGNHKTMKSTPCYLEALSCGAVCGKPLQCGLHKCQRVCHEQPCVPSGTLCVQKCTKPRESCGHPCSNSCHSGPCPDSTCKEVVKISCTCGHRKAAMQCHENDREYRVLATSLLASQMQNMNSGGSVDLSEIFTSATRPDKLKRLACNEECQQLQRNRRLALALQIENPESREKLGNPSVLYSEFMKDEARKDPNLAKTVHDALTDLVIKARESKQKSRSHSFAPMNRDKRQFIHEYCEHFGCQSQSYDEEPKKNVVATAVRGMCFLPPVSVVTLVLREQGQKKAPVPVWSRAASDSSDGRQGMKKLEKASSVEKDTDSTAASKPPPIDYFDFDE